MEKNLPLNGIVVNAYLRLIERRSRFDKRLPSVLAIDSFFFEAWVTGHRSFDTVRSRFVGVDIAKLNMILIPAHVAGNPGHYFLIVIRPDFKEINVFDSLGHSRWDALAEMMYFLEAYHRDRKLPFDTAAWELKETPAELPRQTDQVSCGIYTLVFAEKLSRVKSIYDRKICPTRARETILSILKAKKFGQESFPAELGNKLPPQDNPALMIDLTSPSPTSTVMEIDLSPTPNPLTHELSVLEETLEKSLRPPKVANLFFESRTEPTVPLKHTITDDAVPEAERAISPVLSICASETGLSSPTKPVLVSETLNVFETSKSSGIPKPGLPDRLLERLSLRNDSFTRKQKKNQKWRVRLPDGTFYRMSTKKLKRLQQSSS